MTYIPRHKVTDLIPNKFEAIKIAAMEARRLNDKARTYNVNLPGKTTSIAKLAHLLKKEGRSVMLAAGFWVFCLSDFVAARNFGLLTGLTVLAALAADLLLLPAVLRLTGGRMNLLMTMLPPGWLL